MIQPTTLLICLLWLTISAKAFDQDGGLNFPCMATSSFVAGIGAPLGCDKYRCFTREELKAEFNDNDLSLILQYLGIPPPLVELLFTPVKGILGIATGGILGSLKGLGNEDKICKIIQIIQYKNKCPLNCNRSFNGRTEERSKDTPKKLLDSR